jgi:hypothetical protein
MGSLNGNFRTTCIVAAAMLIGISQALADNHEPGHTVVYDLTPELNAIGASGTITTDGERGVLSASDIIDWSILLHPPSLPSDNTRYDFTFTPINSYLAANLLGSSLTADPAGLHWNFGANDEGEIFNIQVRASSFGCSTCVIALEAYGSPPLIVFSGIGYWNSAPAPALLLLGFCGLGFMTHGRRKEIATSTSG